MGARSQRQQPQGPNRLRRVQPGYSVKEYAALLVMAEREGVKLGVLVRKITKERLIAEGFLPKPDV